MVQLDSAILFSLYLSLALAITTAAAAARKPFSEAKNIVKVGCESKCGNLTVPYPFGIGINSGCSINPSFDINCSHSSSSPTAFIANTSQEIVGISDDHVRIKNNINVAAACYINETGTITGQNLKEINLTSTTYSFSDTNMLTVVGCDHLAAAGGTGYQEFVASCFSLCFETSPISSDDPIENCAGIGCCQTEITKGIKDFAYALSPVLNLTTFHSLNTCGYAFLADREKVMFRDSDFRDVPIVLDWAIEGRCEEAKKSGVCREHSDCVDSDTGLGGYRCNCSAGY